MSTKRYIELYSADRNRSLYPNPAEFVVPFTNSGANITSMSAMDPITTGPIYYTWEGNFFNVTGETTKTGTTDSLVYLNNTGNVLNVGYNYYLGCKLTISSNDRIVSNYTPSAVSITPNLAFDGITSGANYTISDPSTATTIYIPSVDALGNTILLYSQAYNGYYIIDETLSSSYGYIVSRKIISYDFLTQMATLESTFPTTGTYTWALTDYYTIRKSLPSLSTTASACTLNTITLAGTVPLSQNIDYYRGQYIYLTPITTASDIPNGFTSTPNPMYNTSYLITGYTPISSTSGIFTVNSSTFGTVTTLNYLANIVSFVKDNAGVLSYTGSLVSQNEPVCYEIALINLSLPNVTLKTGSRVAFYPYVYVQFTNANGAISNNIIYSNNSDASEALFIAPVTDISQPVNSSFLKIDSGAMTQTCKFKANDSIKFSVFLPDGTLFQTYEDDYMSPYPTKGSLQIEAVFSIKRL
jgi:hypothetical protein